MPTTPASTSLPSLPRLHDLPQTMPGRVLLAVSATAFVAICAHISVPLYFTPVPVTLQTFAVLLIGLLFGPALGAVTLVLYLMEGAIGLPVFSPHGPGGIAQLLGPTGGFLLSYPIAAATAGWIVRAVPQHVSKFSAAVLASLAATAVIFALGAPWTALWLHLSTGAAWQAAVLPFLPGEGLKIAAAAAAYTTYRRWRTRD